MDLEKQQQQLQQQAKTSDTTQGPYVVDSSSTDKNNNKVEVKVNQPVQQNQSQTQGENDEKKKKLELLILIASVFAFYPMKFKPSLRKNYWFVFPLMIWWLVETVLILEAGAETLTIIFLVCWWLDRLYHFYSVEKFRSQRNLFTNYFIFCLCDVIFAIIEYSTRGDNDEFYWVDIFFVPSLLAIFPMIGAYKYKVTYLKNEPKQ